MKKSTIALLTLTLTLGLAASAFAWHGGGNGGHNRGWHGKEHGGYARNSNIPFDQHGGGHEWAADSKAIHDKEMQDPNHKDALDYSAPHQKGPGCEGMTGPHGRHLTGN